jgi:hypothetical protein
LEGSGVPVLYIGRTVFKFKTGCINNYHYYFNSVILSKFLNANINCYHYSVTSTVQLKILSVILTRLCEHEPLDM